VATVEETVSQLKKWNKGTEATTWAIVECEDSEALGRVSMIPRERKIWEAAIMLVPKAQGRGLGFGGLSQALDIVFEKHAARRVFADIDPDNGPSIRLFERLGFRKEGLLRANWRTHLGVRDSVIMGLINTDPRQWKSS
jgi:RimJ/RimL family protein N-acetyltransferase